MSLTASATFPELWSTKVQRNADDALVVAPLVTRRYEGEIKQKGDTVHITQWPNVFSAASSSTGAVTVPGYYTRATAIGDSSVTAATRALTIHQERALRVVVDDVDEAQSIFNLVEGLGTRFAYAFARTIETYLWSYAGSDETTGSRASYSGSQAAGGNYGKPGTAYRAMSAGNSYDWCVDINADLSSRNCAPGRRCVVVPPVFTAALSKESELTGISTEAVAKEVVIGGMVARTGGLDIIESNIFIKNAYWAQSLYDDTDETMTATSGTQTTLGTYHVFGGNLGEAIAFAKQINKVAARPADDGFHVNLMQLCVYGGLLLDPTSFFDAIITP